MKYVRLDGTEEKAIYSHLRARKCIKKWLRRKRKERIRSRSA